MNLAVDVEAELPALRAQAEALMVDTIRFNASGSTVFDENTGDYANTPGAELYHGKCQVQVTDSVTTTGENVGEQLVITERVTIKVPITAPVIPINSVGEITAVADISDPSLVGRKYRVTGSHAATYKTARRLPCEQVTS